MSGSIIFPPNVIKFAELQTNFERQLYEECPEFESVSSNLLLVERKKVVDIGCGIGRASVWLFKNMLFDSEFHLVDGNTCDKRYKGLRKNDGEYYNSLDATQEFCTANGMKNFKCHNAATAWWKCVDNVDLVVSLLAIGFHWPISLYLEKLWSITSKGCLLVFGTRGVENMDWVKQQVESVSGFEISKVLIGKRNDRNSIIVLEKP